MAKIKRSLSWPLQLTKLWAEGSPDVCPVHAVLCFLQDLFSSGLRRRAHLVLLFIFEGRGVSASSTLPTSRLLNYYFVGSRDRSQLTRPAPLVKVGLTSPWVGQTASTEVSWSLLLTDGPSPNLFGDTFTGEMWTENTSSLSRVGLIIPSLTGGGDERESRCWQREGLGESKAVYTVLQIQVSGL